MNSQSAWYGAVTASGNAASSQYRPAIQIAGSLRTLTLSE